ncbi:hypothetical protein BC830DRAFT_1245144 [Chytriomyces sp. MP71]|nr:hypothetical protein BC830DRAFT_1260163 [Chytriomyces sp. MP71]KAI8612084.1 hypothetical protein BC830DRAFT_1245144 [Chytriomyces sp. MP71]
MSVEEADKDGETPLLKAAYSGHLGVVRFLLERGANVAHADKDGWTALHNACARGFEDIVRVLLASQNVAINALSITRFSPLMSASAKGHVHIVSLLLDHGADTNPTNKYGDSALALAAQNEHPHIVLLLADKNVTHPYSPTPSTSGTQHSSALELVFESQKRPAPSPSLLFNRKTDFGSSTFALCEQPLTPASLVHPQPIQALTSVTLPLGDRWFWLTDWRACRQPLPGDAVPSDEDGWRYALEGDPMRYWGDVARMPAGVAVLRERRWIRVRKRRLDFVRWMDVGRVGSGATGSQMMMPSGHQAAHLGSDYVERATTVLTEVGSHASLMEPPERGVWTRELERYESAIRILLTGLKLDTDESRKRDAMLKVSALLTAAEEIVDRVPRNTDTHTIVEATDILDGITVEDGPNSATTQMHVSEEEIFPETTVYPSDSARVGDLEVDWRASILASSGWIMDAGEIAVDPTSPSALTAFPVHVNDAHGRWISHDALHYVQNDASSDQEPIRGDEEEDAMVRRLNGTDTDTSAPNVRFRVLQPLPSSGGGGAGGSLRLSLHARTPLAPTTTEVIAMRSPRIGGVVTGMQGEGAAEEEEVRVIDFGRSRSASLASLASSSAEFHVAAAVGEGGAEEVSLPSPPTLELTGGGLAVPGASAAAALGAPPLERSPFGSWQSSDAVSQCKICRRRFTLFLRKHHCRWCGYVVCDSCSSHRVAMHDPVAAASGTSVGSSSSSSSSSAVALTFQRVCETCYGYLTSMDSPLYRNPMTSATPPAHLDVAGMAAGGGVASTGGSAMDLLSQFASVISSTFTTGYTGSGVVGEGRGEEEVGEQEEGPVGEEGRHGSGMSDSVMLECPVCQRSLLRMGSKEVAEAHVAECLSGDRAGDVNGNRYIVQTLKESMETECVICFNDLEVGERVARLNCLCIYHEACIKSWFKKKGSCPVHYQ